MLAPVTARAKFVEEDGTVRTAFTTDLLSDFWRRYHVDFDRIVLEGADAALAMACAHPIFYSGLVLRGGKVDPALVRNYAPLPVFVFDETIEKELKAAGHPDVTRGDAAALTAWMNSEKTVRKVPTKFSWSVKVPDQTVAYWVNVVAYDPVAAERSLVVEADPKTNVLKIDAKAISEVTLFLNDRIVDLGKDVTLLLNGHEQKRPPPGRDFDGMMSSDTFKLRKSLYLGWLYPAKLVGLKIRPPKQASKPNDKPATAPDKPAPKEIDPMAELAAQDFVEQAEKFEAQNDLAKALELYRKVLKEGYTSFQEKAAAKVKELEGKAGAAGTGAPK
jgi:hypothetical protein